MMGDEADALNDQGDGGAEDFFREMNEQHYQNHINEMLARYRDNKRADIGTTIECPCCAKKIIKKSYQTQFCSNKGKGNCKDTYWNNVNDDRRDRSHRFS